MNKTAALWRRLSVLLGRDQFRSELEEELAFHRTQIERELIKSGMTAAAAGKAAGRQLGNRQKIREESQDVVAFRMETVLHDLRYAARQLYLNPGFTVVITLTLALSIGANSAISASSMQCS